MTSSRAMLRRAAHWVHSVTVPAARMMASRSASPADSGSTNPSALPGSANHADSPVSHSDTSLPAAQAVAATVNAWAHRSGASAPDVIFTTSRRATAHAYHTTLTTDRPRPVMLAVMSATETFYLVLLIMAFLVIGWFAIFVVYKLFAGQR